MLDKKFDVIYADCPWTYSDKMGGKNNPFAHSIGRHYDTLSTKDILALDVKSIAKKDAWLFLWVPSALLPEGIETVKSWGFKYKTIAFVMLKKTKTGKPFCTRSRSSTMSGTEVCLVGKRGRPHKDSHTVKQVVESIRTKHSAKPDEVYSRIEELVGPEAKKVELFARKSWDGWTAIGNEIDGKDIRDVIGVINE